MRVTEQCFSLILLKWLKFGKYFDLTSFIVLYCEKKQKQKQKQLMLIIEDTTHAHTVQSQQKPPGDIYRFLLLAGFCSFPFFCIVSNTIKSTYFIQIRI